MGGIDKPRLLVGGVSMLDRAIVAVRELDASSIIAVGPEPACAQASRPTSAAAPTTKSTRATTTPVQWVREDPPFTGPAAAIVAALAVPAAHDPEWTFVLACDLPRVDAAVRQLLDDIVLLPSDTDGACLSDASSRPQWLTGVYRTDALRRAAASVADQGRDQSVRSLFADLAIASVADRSGGADDIDTWEDFRRFTKEDV